jgi:hypothetical protein
MGKTWTPIEWGRGGDVEGTWTPMSMFALFVLSSCFVPILNSNAHQLESGKAKRHGIVTKKAI